MGIYSPSAYWPCDSYVGDDPVEPTSFYLPDASGNGDVLFGSEPPVIVPGRLGGALQTVTGLLTEHPTIIPGGAVDWSVCFWAKGTGGDTRLEGWYGPDAPMQIHGSAGTWHVVLPGVGTVATLGDESAAWQHFVLVYFGDDNALVGYRDGRLVSVEAEVSISTWQAFGFDLHAGDKLIDDVRIYDFGLSQAEVRQLFCPGPTRCGLSIGARL